MQIKPLPLIINFVKVHANQAPVTLFVYVFIVVNVVNVLWD